MSIAPGEAMLDDDALVLRIDVSLAHSHHGSEESDHDHADSMRMALHDSVHVMTEFGEIVTSRLLTHDTDHQWVALRFALREDDRAVAIRYAPLSQGIALPQQLQIALDDAAQAPLRLSANGNTELVLLRREEGGPDRLERVSGSDEPTISILRVPSGDASEVRIDVSWLALRRWSGFGERGVATTDQADAFLADFERWVRQQIGFLNGHGQSVHVAACETTFIDVSGAPITNGVAAARAPVFLRLRSAMVVDEVQAIDELRWSGFNNASLQARVVEIRADQEIEAATLNPSQRHYSLSRSSAGPRVD